MTLPGFNAEKSLYTTRARYRLVGAPVRVDGLALLQLIVSCDLAQELCIENARGFWI
jgi:hypothetical protein